MKYNIEELKYNMEDLDYEELKYEELILQLDLLFPNAKFSISCVDNIKELDDVIDDNNEFIILKIFNNCYCYSNSNKPNEYITVKRKSNKKYITLFIK